MDPTKFMIIAKGKICTESVKDCVANNEKHQYDVTYTNNRTYSYAFGNVIYMRNPTILRPDDYRITTPEGKTLFDVRWIYQFENQHEKYWHIVFDDFALDYRKSELEIVENVLSEEKSQNVFQYLTEISELSDIQNDNGEIILKKNYAKTGFVPNDTVFCLYLDPSKTVEVMECGNVIFPFGCNQSQYQAVKNALSNQLSVIQGPPGTGKTQTILNIISNIIVSGKTVLVVSNNNSATLNVLEKLSKPEYGMNFMVASLGSAKNKAAFVNSQTERYPDLSSWENTNDIEVLKEEASNAADRLQEYYQLQEKLARLKETRYEVEIEFKHFLEFEADTAFDHHAIRVRGTMNSDRILRLWQELQENVDNRQKLSVFFKLKSILFYGIANWGFYRQDLSEIIAVLQKLYYEQALREYDEQIKAITQKLEQQSGDYAQILEEKSVSYLKAYIAKRYPWRDKRVKFSEDDLYCRSMEVLREYPIILSTTFSALTSLNWRDIVYDYVIMDEASQVDIATGALAFACAKNAVVVGDLKQLPNVVPRDVEQKADIIRTRYHLNEAYDFSRKSFLQSIVELIPNVSSTLLKEHYRCHPRIIQFCNQKFYDNELVIMTEDDHSGNALMAVKTVEGNHARGNYNQRQIDVIKDEILPSIVSSREKIGIIAPYNDQVNELRRQIPDIDVATVHKFQGREKDIIILSTVDNQIRDFTDDPYLLNVAVSRAKKRLIVVVSGNEQEKKGNILDLISYIQYNKMEVMESKVYSVFDYLYSQYRDRRWEKLKKRNVSEYESENLTYSLLIDMLKDFPDYGVVCFEPLFMIVREVTGLSDEEMRYAMHPSTHVDFLIYNKFSKLPVLAVETDGYVFHKEGTAQYDRDRKKDGILEKCGIPMVRLKTNGSSERERIARALELKGSGS